VEGNGDDPRSVRMTKESLRSRAVVKQKARPVKRFGLLGKIQVPQHAVPIPQRDRGLSRVFLHVDPVFHLQSRFGHEKRCVHAVLDVLSSSIHACLSGYSAVSSTRESEIARNPNWFFGMR
jgi:hypothetical protein